MNRIVYLTIREISYEGYHPVNMYQWAAFSTQAKAQAYLAKCADDTFVIQAITIDAEPPLGGLGKEWIA